MTPTADEIERVARAMRPYFNGQANHSAAAAAIQAMNQRGEPDAWCCEERTMGVWYKRYVTEEPQGGRYRNVTPLYK
jgi:hypothetical protein